MGASSRASRIRTAGAKPRTISTFATVLVFAAMVSGAAAGVALATGPLASFTASHSSSPSNGTGNGTSWDWTAVSSSAAPSPRAGAAMVYDAADGYTLLFGGCAAWGGVYWSHDCTALGDTWILSGGSWTNITSRLALSPPARADAGIAYDAVDRAVVLFGGFNGTTVYNDTWTYAAGNWTEVTTTLSPPARFSMGMVGDPADHEVVMFGGSNSSSPEAVYLNDTWTYQNGTWTPVSTPTAPAPRCSMAVSYDPLSQQVVLFGGWSNAVPLSFGDTWTFSAGTWTNITTANGPVPRNYAAMAFDPALGASILTGGHVVADAYADTWGENTTAGWQQIPTNNAPPARWGLELSYDGTSEQLYLFGGVNAAATFYNDTWVLSNSSQPVTDYAVDFSEFGLPNGTSWSVNLSGQVSVSTSASIVFEEPNGIYAPTVTANPNYSASFTSPVVVSGAPTMVFVQFYNVSNGSNGTVPVLVQESGLPQGAEWTVSATNIATQVETEASSTNATAVLQLSSGHYALAVGGPAGYGGTLSATELTVNPGSPISLTATFATTGTPGGGPGAATAAGVPWTLIGVVAAAALVSIVGAGWGFSRYQYARRRATAQNWVQRFHGDGTEDPIQAPK
jgi:hypothetical protein